MTTPVTPIFYLPYPFVLPRSSRPRNLTQIVRFFHFLFNSQENEEQLREDWLIKFDVSNSNSKNN